MSGIRRFVFRLGSLFRRQRIEADLAEELRLHLELQTEANLRAGLPADEARREAVKDLGGLDQVMERYRDERRLRWLENLGGDLKQGLRSVRRNRAFTATVVAILALCV